MGMRTDCGVLKDEQAGCHGEDGERRAAHVDRHPDDQRLRLLARPGGCLDHDFRFLRA